MKPFLRRVTLALAAIAAGTATAGESGNPDWPNLAKYREANAELTATANNARVVFMGDSITEGWGDVADSVFANRDYVNRGISGQTTPQMLLRFRADVIELHPRAVVILAGTNDIAGNTGPATLEQIEGNIASMVELARAHRIRVVLASLLPAAHYGWAPEVKPIERIAALNRWIAAYAQAHGLVHIDYYSPLADAGSALKKEYSEDGVHPNAAGYKVMNAIVRQGIARAFGRAGAHQAAKSQ
jgi:lysophospholipase L1-like esterase